MKKDKIGGTVEVAYDVRCDTDYEEMMNAKDISDDPDGNYFTIARTSPVQNHTVSTIYTIIIALYFLGVVFYVFRCYKQPEPAVY